MHKNYGFWSLIIVHYTIAKICLIGIKRKKKKSTPIAREKRPKFLKANLDKVSQFFEHSVVFLVFKDKCFVGQRFCWPFCWIWKLAANSVKDYCLRKRIWHAQSTSWKLMMSEKPQKFSEKSLKIMFLWRAFCKYHRLLSNSSSLVLKSQVVSVFGKFFKSCSRASLFLGSGVAVYQTAMTQWAMV